jgi:putative Ca2+/H+ antiporter (TMEM165/GDT1 family)
MKTSVFFTIFAAIFIAELGDKTQFATLLFASNKETDKLTVFLAAAIALVLTSAIGVVAGSLLSQYVNETYLRLIAGIGFIGIGIWTLITA